MLKHLGWNEINIENSLFSILKEYDDRNANDTYVKTVMSLWISDQKLWLVPRSIDKNKSDNTGQNLGLCLKTLFDLTDDLIPNMVSFMEMQRLLGVDQVNFFL